MTSRKHLRQDANIILYPSAIEAINNELMCVFRFADHPLVTRDTQFRNSVYDHTNSTSQFACSIIADAVPDLRLQNMLQRIAQNEIAPHDYGEVVHELLTGVGETDPELQRRVKTARLTELEAETASFAFQAAVFLHQQKRLDEFAPYIQHIRQSCNVPNDGYGFAVKDADTAICYAAQARVLMMPAVFDKSPHLSRWNHPSITTEVNQMMYFYNDIEGLGPDAQSFMGQFCKRVEKWEGTHYMIGVNTQKSETDSYRGILLQDSPPHQIPLFNGRFENGLFALHETAQQTVDPTLRQAFKAMAEGFTRRAYQTSCDGYQAGPADIIYKDHIFNRDDIVDYYQGLLAQPQIHVQPGNVLDRYMRIAA